MNTDTLITGGVIGFILFVFNAVFLVIILFMRRRMATVSQWPSTMGTVMMSTLERRRSGDSGYADYPVVEYSYRVDGRAYQSMKLAPGPDVGGSGAWKVVEKYPAGAQVMVFYDPQNPADAVLERKAPALWVMWLILGILDCSLCGVLPIVWWAFQQ